MTQSQQNLFKVLCQRILSQQALQQQQQHTFLPVISTQHSLYSRYSSSQHYFYSNKITEIIKQKCVPNNIVFQDVECFIDEEEYLKREYRMDQYHRKLSTFKQYYFYHEDCPRIFGNLGIADYYQRWHEKKRDYVYKKLKFMYNQTYSSMDSTQKSIQEMAGNPANVTHFLLQISQYNPYSKKYYLRVQARQDKEKEKQKQKQKQKLKQRQNQNQSVEMYRNFNAQLSQMLNKINDELSVLTVVEESEGNQGNFMLDYNQSGGKIGIKASQSYKDKSRNTTIKLNFRKKQVGEIQHLRESDTLKTKKNIEIESPNRQSLNNYLYIETEGSDNNMKSREKQKHKKYASEMNQNQLAMEQKYRKQYQLNNNLQISDTKKKSILLMSSLGYKNYVGQVQERGTGRQLNDEKRQTKRAQLVPPIQNYNTLKSYRSLQKYNRYNPSTQQQREQKNQLKQKSLSKLIRISPTKQKPLKQSLANIMDTKLENRQSSLKKIGWEQQKHNVEEFNDRKIVHVYGETNNIKDKEIGKDRGYKGLVSYRSERIQPSTSGSVANFNLLLFKNSSSLSKGQSGSKVGGSAIKQTQMRKRIRDDVQSDKKLVKVGSMQRIDNKQKKRNIRISFKHNDNIPINTNNNNK